MRRVAMIFAALAALAMVSDVADAAPRRGVIVRVVEGAPVGASAATSALAQALRTSGAEVIEDPLALARARLSDGAVERSRLADFRRARELAREGWRAYLSADLRFAEAQLVNARRTLESVLDLDGALELLADVSLRLGAVRLKSGRSADAQAAFTLAVTLDLGRELLAHEFSPALAAAYQQAAARTATPSAPLEVVVPRGALLELDGVAADRRTLRVVPGEHVIVVRAPGRRAAGQIVLVPASGTRVELPLEDHAHAHALAAPPLPIGVGERAASLVVDAVGLFADLSELWLFVVTWRSGQPALLGQRCLLTPLSCTPVHEVRFASARVDAASRQLVRDLLASRPGPLGPIVLEDTRATEPERPARSSSAGPALRPWWKSGWLWAGLGAAVAAGATVWLVADGGSGPVEWTLPPLRAP